MRIFFIRHAESLKSKEDRHGGEGLPLTVEGRQDVLDIASHLIHEGVRSNAAIIFCSSLPQVLETAELLTSATEIPHSVRNELKNIGLGVLNGLSTSEALQQFPEVAKNLELWRNGKMGVDEFSIPGGETPEEFYKRVSSFIEEVKRLTYDDVLIIGTRSIGVAISNRIANKLTKFIPERYKRYLFDPGSTSLFVLAQKDSKLLYINRTDYLKHKPRYPDV